MEKAMAPHSSTLAWKIPWWRSLEGCSPWGRWGSDMTEQLHFHFSLSCIGEGNGNPLQCSCLENPRDGGAWWAAIYGVAQSQTRLKQLSSSSSSSSSSSFANNGLSSQSYGFSVSHEWMWELDYKESWAPKNCCFWIVVLDKTLKSPLDCKEIELFNPKYSEISPEYSLEGLMVNLKLQYFGHLMRRTDSL